MAKLLCAPLLAALALLSGCTAASKTRSAPPSIGFWNAADQTLDSSDGYRLAQDHFLAARDYERRGAHEAAFELYEVAYDFWPKSSYLRKILADKYMQDDRYDSALGLFTDTRLPDLTPDELRKLSLIHLRVGNVPQAAEAIEALGGDMSEEEMYSLGLLYESLGQKEMALRGFREFFSNNPRSAGLGVKMVQFNVGERRLADAESLAVILRGAYPDNAEAAALLGTVKHLSRDTSAAVALFNEALKLDSLNEEALRTLAHISLVREQYPEAISFYRRLTAQSSIAPIYRRGLAFLLFHAKEYAAAEGILDTLILEDDGKELPGKPELHVYRGLIYAQTKRAEKAAQEFRAATAIDPRYEDAWKELCYLYIVAKDKEKAQKAVDDYIAAFPNSGAGWRFRGYVLNMREKYDEAVAALRKAVEIDSGDHLSWFETGSILEKRKRVDEAAAAFKQVLRIRPGDAMAANYLGYMWADAGMMLDSAKLLIEMALAKDSLNGAYLDSYAWVFYQMGDYKKALLYMNKALEQNSLKEDPVPYEHLGDIYFKMSDYQAAESAYKRSLELKTEDAKRIKERIAEIKNLMRKKER
ncbi:MAG: tetratricopeptide repeat protein [Chitinispirillales bacterium]|jgi:tetratricopeptide (TPR) repeat protein|nr:tetratricopeptide repeat protein [Chitinispirillales bacterium]